MGDTAGTATRERPIIFSGPMVRAILAGRKTQTRRVVTVNHASWKPDNGKTADPCSGTLVYHDGSAWDFAVLREHLTRPGFVRPISICPYGSPGDRLWVRESFCLDWSSEIVYRADDPTGRAARNAGYPAEPRWKPSIHMPRWASRITPEVTGVRVERVQSVSEADALADGGWTYGSCPVHKAPEASYAALWDVINGKRHPWASNPWVWVIEFRWVEG